MFDYYTNVQKRVRYSLAQNLIAGIRMTVDIFDTDFRIIDISAVSGITIRGPLTLHRIETVDGPFSGGQVIPHSDTHPTLLIDDFSQWTNPLINMVNGARHVSEFAQTGPGNVKLLGNTDCLVEYFASPSTPFNLQYMAFRNTYASDIYQEHNFGLSIWPRENIRRIPRFQLVQ